MDNTIFLVKHFSGFAIMPTLHLKMPETANGIITALIDALRNAMQYQYVWRHRINFVS